MLFIAMVADRCQYLCPLYAGVCFCYCKLLMVCNDHVFVSTQHIQAVYNILSKVFLVFPQFSFGNGLMELARVDLQVQILSTYGVDAYKNPFSLDVLGWMLISLVLQGFICFTLRLLMNKWLLRRVRWGVWSRAESGGKTDDRSDGL